LNTTAAILNPRQQEALDGYRSLTDAASWHIGEPGHYGDVQVVAVGCHADPFVWVIHIDSGGEAFSAEASLGRFGTEEVTVRRSSPVNERN
jgi:hypothetical protein